MMTRVQNNLIENPNRNALFSKLEHLMCIALIKNLIVMCLFSESHVLTMKILTNGFLFLLSC